MASTKAYTITTEGTWPNEKYVVGLDGNLIDPALHSIPAYNYFRFNNSIDVPINYYNSYDYLNSAPVFDTQGLNAIDTTASTSLVWNVSSERRLFNIGNTFNTLAIDIAPGSNISNKYYCYYINPKRLLLKPTSKPTFNGTNWTLNTETVLKDEYTRFYLSSASDVSGALEIRKENVSKPTTSSLPINNYSIVYNMSSCRMRNNIPVISFTPTNNPIFLSTVLEPSPSTSVDKSRIRPDSTFVTYSVIFYADYGPSNGGIKMGNLGQERFDNVATYGSLPTLKSSYIMTDKFPVDLSTKTQNDKQIFQLLQIKNDSSLSDLSDTKYCVLCATFNLSDSNFTYLSKNYFTGTTIVNTITGLPDTNIGVSYIADCPTLQFTQEKWQDTVNSVTTPLGVPLTGSSSTHSSIDWVTKYPPHYYSYKASLKDDNDPSQSLMETSDLTFFLRSPIISQEYTPKGWNYSATLSTYIGSDHDFVTYDLSFGAPDDYIKFTPSLDASNVILDDVYAYYGSSLNIPYDLKSSPWIKASDANQLKISYPFEKHGEIEFTILSTLSSFAGILDSFEKTNIKLAIGQPPNNSGQPIFISKIFEVADRLEADSSFLVNDTSWPTRDLNGSNISWFVEPINSTTSINAVDLNGKYLQSITPGQSILFNSNTQTVAVSGYGPQTIVLTLSSQKYNETTSVSSVSSLFDYFSEGYLLVGSPNGVNNLNKTRSLYLTAAVPYKGRQYDIPQSGKICWTWSYNGQTYDTSPVSAYYIADNTPYVFGTDDSNIVLSSIYFEIEPPYNTVPNLNNFDVLASIDTPKGLIDGTYNILLDDFPNPSIFNTDFLTYYSSFDNYTTVYNPLVSNDISNTRLTKNVITRPNNNTNAFNLYSHSDVIPRFASTSTIIWNVSSTDNDLYDVNNTNTISYTKNKKSDTIISLSALNAIVPGWTFPHNIKSELSIHILDENEFNKNLEFISIPEYFWNSGRYATVSDTSNFTQIQSSNKFGTFGNKKSNSQTYYLSTNKPYSNDLIYTMGISSPFTIFDGVTSSYELIDIPYRTEMFTSSGLYISVFAYDTLYYPRKMGPTYKIPDSGSLVTKSFNIKAETLSNSSNLLRNTLKLKDYTDITFSFYPLATSINVDTDRTISITQKISTNPLESPVQVDYGTITYTLSTYFWKEQKVVPAVDGTFNLFNINIGDKFKTLTVDNRNNTMVLQASANVYKKVPSSTFNDYANNQYTNERDLWNSVNQITPFISSVNIKTNSDVAIPSIFISTAYTLTGSNIFIQFDTPEYQTNKIVAYMANFGEANSYKILSYDSTLFYNYKNSGTYYISYSALFKDGSYLEFKNPNPIIVKDSWEVYDPNALRFVEETILSLPYSNDQVLIQPNEWGDEDIFNSTISRLSDNLDYLISNVQTLDTKSPTLLFGWLGTNPNYLANGIRWYTKDTDSFIYDAPEFSVSQGSSYFSNIKDASEVNDRMFILEGNTFKALSSTYFAPDINLNGTDGLKTTLLNPVSLEMNEDGTVAYIVDPPNNKVYRFDLQFSTTPPELNYSINIGGLGTSFDNNKFNSPSEISYASGRLYVLDYNNDCIKQYNSLLNWRYTYRNPIFEIEQPITIAAHPKFNMLYVLTDNKIIYIFDDLSSDYIASFNIKEVVGDVIKMSFDESGDFIYILTTNNVYKYSPSGYYITTLILSKSILNFVSIKKASNRSMLLITKNSVIKIQDILSVYRIGGGIHSEYWSKDQLLIDRNEFSSDINYNRSLIRMGQNIKTFRKTLNYKLVLATEQTSNGIVTYFAKAPISYTELPMFDDTIELDSIGVGINELHVPQTINKELIKLQNALMSLKDFLDIKQLTLENSKLLDKCGGEFCWSWGAMSCYNFKLPVIRICNINPITYEELENNSITVYAPNKSWNLATSDCCSKVPTPFTGLNCSF